MPRLGSIAIVGVLGLLLMLTALDLSGHRLLVVSGASMEPAIGRGSLVVARLTLPAALAVGDVVAFQHRGATVTHRIAGIDEHGDERVFTTKGDANELADPDALAFDDRVGLVVGQLPLAGYLVAVLQAYGRPLSLAAALVLAAWAFRRARSRGLPAPASA